MSDDNPRPKPPRPSNPEFPYHESATARRADLDSRLRAYLEEHEQDKAEGNTIANVRIEMHQLQVDMREMNMRMKTTELRLDRHGRAIREIRQRLDLDGDDVDTGVHQVEDLRKHLQAKEQEHKMELKEHRDSIWWRRQKINWMVAALGSSFVLTLSTIGTLIWYILTHGK